MSSYKNLFITGASRGIGRALALAYAGPGVTLGICARELKHLKKVKIELEAKGATVYPYGVDVVNSALMENSISTFLTKVKTIDLVIANAGAILALQDHLYSTNELNSIIDINVKGVINTTRPFFETMLEQKKGQCVVVSSAAGYYGVPGGTYGASKAAVRILMDSWRVRFHKTGIIFTTLNPGNVKTDMHKNSTFQPPFLVSAEKMAVLMKKAIQAKKRNVMLPRALGIGIRFTLMLPWRFQRMILRSVQPKLDIQKVLSQKKTKKKRNNSKRPQD